MNKRLLILLAGLIAITLVAKTVILSGAKVVKLNAAPPLSGLVAQSLYNGQNPIPSAGKDFQLTNVSYFQNKNWVVLNIASPDNKLETGTLVLEKFGGNYQVVLGPGTQFDQSYIYVLPPEVAQDLINIGVLSGTSN